MKRKIFLALYYGFARYLPQSHIGLLGRWGGKIRRCCAKRLFKFCASDVNIERMASFGSGREVEIGSHSGIGINCHVPNNIKIGENVMMGPQCIFLDSVTHVIDRLDVPMIKQGKKPVAPIVIGDDVWIGRETMVLPGKNIGSHTVIGARSVVSRDIPDYVVAAGNPCRVKKERK